ncbi:TPA: hypothetical protein JIP90_000435 [Acinetobacter baumannii]|nr:hypothetical protein [Acinetobacter baumannii]HAV4193745.1 hypothetical protein [Acinetobacter baumannii]
MEYAKLENLYDTYISKDGYPKLSRLASKNDVRDNIGLIMIFLTANFKTKNKKLFFDNDFKISVDDKVVALDLTQAPDFKDQDKFLAWLHQQIFNQT